MAKQKSTEVALVQTGLSATETARLLNEKYESMKRISVTPFKTSGILKFPGNVEVNITTETNITKLIQCLGYVISKEKAYNEAVIALERGTAEVHTESGYTTALWKEDIKLRITIIEQDATFKALEEFKKRNENLMSLADQRELLAKDMEDFFSKNNI